MVRLADAKHYEDLPLEQWKRQARYIARTGPWCSKLERDDAYAEAYLGLAVAMRTYRAGMGFSPLTWMHQRVSSVLRDAMMAWTHCSRINGPTRVVVEQLPLDDDDAPDALFARERADETTAVQEAVRVLTRQQRTFLVMRMDEATCPEIAAALGVSVPRVHQIRRETEKRLRDAGIL